MRIFNGDSDPDTVEFTVEIPRSEWSVLGGLQSEINEIVGYSGSPASRQLEKLKEAAILLERLWSS